MSLTPSISKVFQGPRLIPRTPVRLYTTMTTKALVLVEKGKVAIEEVPLPKLRDDYVLVKVNAVGINPTDWKHIDFGIANAGSRIGCDYAGIVEAVGSRVTKPFNKGDRISGVVHGGDQTQHENGAFANHIVAKGDIQIKTPDNISDEEAATLGISISTVGQGLYRTLGLPLPVEATQGVQYILIYGGSTATGIFGIQFARLSGLKVVTTASPHNFEYLKSLGADAAFDYKSPTVADDIRKYTNNTLKLAWDCTGFGGPIVAGSLSSEGGKYASIMPVRKEEVLAVNPNVDGPYVTLMYSIFGERVIKGDEIPANHEEFEFAKTFWEISRQLLEQGKLKSPRTVVNKGGYGLKGILKGLDELRANNVSGEKLVYTL
ncbi:chaperonin 10-like protein [Xylaria flabelliformis]|nr:chaperonin 10-like protein [Xylaria flabelliformis]